MANGKKHENITEKYSRIDNSFTRIYNHYTPKSDDSEINIMKNAVREFENPDSATEIEAPIEYQDIVVRRRKKKPRVLLGFFLMLFVGGAVAALLFLPEINNRSDYDVAVSFMERGDYQQAIDTFERLENFRDSERLLLESRYQYGVALFDEGKYDESAEQFRFSGVYKNSNELMKESVYLNAKALLDAGESIKAKEQLKSIAGYKDVDTLLYQDYFDEATELLENGDYYEAMEAFSAIEDDEKANEYYLISKAYYFSTQENIAYSEIENLLVNLGTLNNEDAKSAVQLSIFTPAKLSGSWQTADSKYKIDVSGVDKTIALELELPEGESSFKIDKNMIKREVQGEWEDCIQILQLSPSDSSMPDSVKIKNLYNNEEYVLYRA